MNRKQRHYLYEAEEHLAGALISAPEHTRSAVVIARERVKSVLHAEDAWPPPSSAYEWFVKAIHCGHENVFQSDPGDLMGAKCSECGQPLGGAKPFPRIRPDGPLKMIRVRHPDGTAAEVLATAKAIPIQPKDPPAQPSMVPLPLVGEFGSAFDKMASSIERFHGKLVSYQPSPDRAELLIGVVEDEVP